MNTFTVKVNKGRGRTGKTQKKNNSMEDSLEQGCMGLCLCLVFIFVAPPFIAVIIALLWGLSIAAVTVTVIAPDVCIQNITGGVPPVHWSWTVAIFEMLISSTITIITIYYSCKNSDENKRNGGEDDVHGKSTIGFTITGIITLIIVILHGKINYPAGCYGSHLEIFGYVYVYLKIAFMALCLLNLIIYSVRNYGGGGRTVVLRRTATWD